jgi:hypothetical protein
MEAFTWKFEPRYLFIVFAFAGDSTITSDFLVFDFGIFGFHGCAYQSMQQHINNKTRFLNDIEHHEPVIGVFDDEI